MLGFRAATKADQEVTDTTRPSAKRAAAESKAPCRSQCPEIPVST